MLPGTLTCQSVDRVGFAKWGSVYLISAFRPGATREFLKAVARSSGTPHPAGKGVREGHY